VKTKPTLTDADKAAKPKSGRALRVAKRKAYYGAQPQRTIANAKRRLARHIQAHPMAEDAEIIWISRYGKTPTPAPNGRAQRRLKRAKRAAKRHAPSIANE
jgi:hypothetical protein